MKVFGIDVGGSGIKGAPVNVKTGELLFDRHRIPTPHPATPKEVAKVVKQLVDHFDWKDGPIGCGFPSPIQKGVALRATNIDKKFIGTNVEKLLSETTKCPVKVLNDADAAGMGEVKFGAGKGVEGLIFVVTVGTGLGTALFTDGHLVPNTELGHLQLKVGKAEPYASDATKKRLKLSWEEWGKRFNMYLNEIESLFYPDLIIIGGGTSKRFEKYEKYLKLDTKVVPAQLLNQAGTIGAAYAASTLAQ